MISKLLSELKTAGWPFVALMLLALAIGLTPRVPVGTVGDLGRAIDVRGEDILMIALIPLWFVALLKSRRMPNIPLATPILALLTIGFASTLINGLFLDGNLVRGVFYFAKEVQFFFVYFFAFWAVSRADDAKKLLYIWLGAGLANILYVLWQIFFTERGFGEYGTAALAEWGVFPTGAFFLLLFIFLFNWWLYSYWEQSGISWQKRYLYLGMILPVIIGMLGTLSRTNFIGFWLALAASIILYIYRIKKLRSAIFSAALMVAVALFTLGAHYYLIVPYIEGTERISKILNINYLIDETKRTRLSEIKYKFQIVMVEMKPLNYVVGLGRGETEKHNYYARTFAESGLAGLIAFLALIAAIFFKARRGFFASDSPTITGLSAGLIAATTTMLFVSLVTDAFMVVKPNMLYWFFAGLTMAVLYKKEINV